MQTIFDLVGPHYYDRIDRAMSPEDKPEVMARVAAARPDQIAGLRWWRSTRATASAMCSRMAAGC